MKRKTEDSENGFSKKLKIDVLEAIAKNGQNLRQKLLGDFCFQQPGVWSRTLRGIRSQTQFSISLSS